MKTATKILEYQLSRPIALLAAYRFDHQLNNTSMEPGMKRRPSFHFISLGAAFEIGK